MTAYEDDIDLRPYILALIHHWWKIALLVIIVVVAAWFLLRNQPQTYESKATILITHSRATLSLAQQFPTVNDPVDTNSKMNAMLSIAKSDNLALQVLDKLGNTLPPDARSLNFIKGSVSVTGSGDLLVVTATSTDPTQAQDIANTWAQEVVQEINRAYNGEQPLVELKNQRNAIQAQYQQAQSDLESTIRDNRISILEKRIAENEALFSDLADDRVWMINYYNARKQNMHELIVQAEALKGQIESGSFSAAGDLGDALAVLYTRASLLRITQPIHSEKFDPEIPDSENDGSEKPRSSENVQTGSVIPGLSINLQLTYPESIQDTPSNYAADLNVLIQRAEEEKFVAEKALKDLARSVNADKGSGEIETIAANIQQLKAQLESEKAKIMELTSDRDLTWQTYQAMVQKETEVQNTPQSNEVILAVPAVKSQTSTPRNTLKNIVLAGASGLMLGVFIVIILQWWRSSNLVNRQESPLISKEMARDS